MVSWLCCDIAVIGSDEINDCESIASDNNLDDDTLRESPTSNVSNNENDEDWDLDEGQDDYFDPTGKNCC